MNDMKTIAFYSYKGGVGRTLALSNVAMRLVGFGKKVMMLDLDLEAPGLHCKFSNFHSDEKIKSGIVDYIYEYAVNQTIPSSIKSYVCHLQNEVSESLDLIAAGNPRSSEYWRKLSAINWYELLYGDGATGVSFFLDMKEKIAKEFQPDYLLIDTRTGITDLSSLTVSLLADRLVILSANNQENLEGCQRIVRSVLSQENDLLGQEKEVILALTRIPHPTTPEERLREENLVANFKKHFAGLTYASGREIDCNPVVIHSDRNLECSESIKIGFEKETRGALETIANEYLDLFAQVTANDLSEEELLKFDEQKEIRRLVNKIVRIENDVEALQVINEVIERYSKESVFYFLKSDKLLKNNIFDESLSAINNAIRLFPLPEYTLLKAILLYNKGEHEEAYKMIVPIKDISADAFYSYCLIKAMGGKFPEEEIFEDLNQLKEMNYMPAVVGNLIACYQNKIGSFEEAEKSIYKAIEQDKNRPELYTTLAEIKANQEDYLQFYMNIDIALSKGVNLVETMRQLPEIYSKFKKDEKFIALLKRYEKDRVIELLKSL